MGCSSTKIASAAPKLEAPILAEEVKEISDYAEPLANSNPDRIEAALQGLSHQMFRKLAEVLFDSEDPFKSLFDYAAGVRAAGIHDLSITLMGLSPESREKMESGLAEFVDVNTTISGRSLGCRGTCYTDSSADVNTKISGRSLGCRGTCYTDSSAGKTPLDGVEPVEELTEEATDAPVDADQQQPREESEDDDSVVVATVIPKAPSRCCC